jgi:hypothetical protein
MFRSPKSPTKAPSTSAASKRSRRWMSRTLGSPTKDCGALHDCRS